MTYLPIPVGGFVSLVADGTRVGNGARRAPANRSKTTKETKLKLWATVLAIVLKPFTVLRE